MPFSLLVYADEDRAALNETERDVGRTREEFVNHEPQASDLRMDRGGRGEG